MAKEKLQLKLESEIKEGYETFQPDYVKNSKEIGTSIRAVPYHKGNIDIKNGGPSYLLMGKPRAIISALNKDGGTTFSATKIEESFDENGLFVPKKIINADASISVSINKVFENSEIGDILKATLLNIVSGSLISTTIGLESLTSALTNIGLGFPGVYEGHLDPAKGGEAALTSYGIGTVKEGIEILVNKLKGHKKNPANKIKSNSSNKGDKQKKDRDFVNQIINLMSDTYIIRIDSVDNHLQNTYDLFKPVVKKKEIAKGIAAHFGIATMPQVNNKDSAPRPQKKYQSPKPVLSNKTSIRPAP